MNTAALVWTEWAMMFVFIAGVFYWGFRLRKMASESMAGSFLADRNIPGFIGSLSTVATNLNINDFIGGAGMMYAVGAINAHGFLANGIALIFVSLFLVQKLRRINAYSLGQWLEKRYSPFIGSSYSIIWAIVWMLFNLGLYIYGGAFVLNTLMGWNLYYSIVLLSIIASAYTLLGGFGAVVATDVLQLCLMFFPFIFVAVSVWLDIGSPAELALSLPEDKAHFWAPQTKFGPIWLMMGAGVIMSSSYWSCEAQVIQRPLASKSEDDATVSYLGASFWFTILVPLLIGYPALAATKIVPGLENPDFAMPALLKMYLPHGLYGVTIVGLIAGFFSSADSQINAFCSLFTTDIYKKMIVKNRSERHYVITSKIAGAIFTFAAIATAILISTRKEGMMIFAMSVLATIMPPFGAITIAGAISKRVTSTAAATGLVIGGIISIILIVLDRMGNLTRIAEISFPFRGTVTFLTTLTITIILSFFTKPDKIYYQKEHLDISIKVTATHIKLIIMLILAMAAIYAFWTYYFG